MFKKKPPVLYFKRESLALTAVTLEVGFG
jgi:hypothetical protein